MRIKRINIQNKKQINATLICDKCQQIETNYQGSYTLFYLTFVIPKLKCKSCKADAFGTETIAPRFI